MFYGTVTRIPKDESEMVWRTVGYDNPKDPDLEGNFLYEFSQENNWSCYIHTKKDAEFFMNKPEDYIVELVNTRPERPSRPQRPPVAEVAKNDTVDELIAGAKKAAKKSKE